VDEAFWCGGHQWRCTDIGTRVITAIKLELEDEPSSYNGPPYAVAEMVFDEYDIEGCTLQPDIQDVTPPEAQDAADSWDSPEGAVRRPAMANALRDRARAGGLHFNAYLAPGLADWLLAHIAEGNFRDPSEAVFVMLGEQQELELHTDLRRAFFERRIQAGMDAGPGIRTEEVFECLREALEAPRVEPAAWPRGI
jgi:hypothetical protein